MSKEKSSQGKEKAINLEDALIKHLDNEVLISPETRAVEVYENVFEGFYRDKKLSYPDLNRLNDALSIYVNEPFRQGRINALVKAYDAVARFWKFAVEEQSMTRLYERAYQNKDNNCYPLPNTPDAYRSARLKYIAPLKRALMRASRNVDTDPYKFNKAKAELLDAISRMPV